MFSTHHGCVAHIIDVIIIIIIIKLYGIAKV